MRKLLAIVSLVGLSACTVYPDGTLTIHSPPPTTYVAPVYRAPVYVAPIHRPPVFVYPRHHYVRPRPYFYRHHRIYR